MKNNIIKGKWLYNFKKWIVQSLHHTKNKYYQEICFSNSCNFLKNWVGTDKRKEHYGFGIKKRLLVCRSLVFWNR